MVGQSGSHRRGAGALLAQPAAWGALRRLEQNPQTAVRTGKMVEGPKPGQRRIQGASGAGQAPGAAGQKRNTVPQSQVEAVGAFGSLPEMELSIAADFEGVL